MTAKSPPIPPENRSPKGPGGPAHAQTGQPTPGRATNPEKQDQQANTRINTTNQGLQQDR